MRNIIAVLSMICSVLSFAVAAADQTPSPTSKLPIGIPPIGAWYDASPVAVSALTSGTESAPALYSLAGKPEIVGVLRIACSYCIVDGAKVKGQVQIKGDHIVLRNSEIYGYMPGRNDAVVAVDGNDIVIRGNHIHDNGDMNPAFEQDVHGISGRNGTKNVWILENEMHANSGDSVQFGHNHTPGATDGIYIGRNKMYGDKENAVDLKVVSNTVVSENTISHYKTGDAGGGGGVAIVLHYCNHNSKILNNTITGVQVAVSVASVSLTCTPRPVEAFIIGNTIDGVLGNAIQMWDGNNLIHVENNKISNAPVGIDLTNCPRKSTVIGNTFTNVSRKTVYAGPDCRPITTR